MQNGVRLISDDWYYSTYFQSETEPEGRRALCMVLRGKCVSIILGERNLPLGGRAIDLKSLSNSISIDLSVRNFLETR